MASTTVLLSVILLLLTVTTAVNDGELTVMYGVMRSTGYGLFADALANSNLRNDLQSDGRNFTLLAPINSAFHALNMTKPEVTTLRYHVIPRRMSMIDLLSLTTSAVPTLVPGRDLHVEQSRSLITIEGVDIVAPGMHYGRNFALHGIGAVLGSRNTNRSDQSVNNNTAPALYEAASIHTTAKSTALLAVFLLLFVAVGLVACVGLALWIRHWLNLRRVGDDGGGGGGDIALN